MREWPHEKEQCMKTFAFERWCDRLQLPTATRDFLLRLRSSPPVRRVQGRLLNVCGTYASRKMGVSIQFESHTVELWAIYTMEYDREVLEFLISLTSWNCTTRGHPVARPRLCIPRTFSCSARMEPLLKSGSRKRSCLNSW